MYGSLFNRLEDGANAARPITPGDGATVLSWSDRQAATVTRVSPNGKTIAIREDIAKRTDDRGMSDSQSYAYTFDFSAAEREWTLRTDGRWRARGTTKRTSPGLALGYRDHYHDYSF